MHHPVRHHPFSVRILIPLLLLPALAGCGSGGGGGNPAGTGTGAPGNGANTWTISATATALPATAAPVVGGSVQGTGDFLHGTAVTLTARPAPGFAFVGWEENGTTLATTPRYSFTATANRSLTARFRVAHPFVDRVTERGDTLTVAVADFNGDGFPDLLTDYVWLNNGRGGFRAHSDGTLYSYSSSISNIPADMDGDGDPDLIAADWSLNYRRNDGLGSLTSVANAFGGLSNPAGNGTPAVGDLDGDGDLDVAVGAPSGSANIWFNDGNGRFTAGQELGLVYGTTYPAAALADLDGDGDLDLLSANSNLLIWFNDGSGSFTAATQTFSLAYANRLATGDLDGDGDLDLAVGTRNSGVHLFRNDGQGGFTALTPLAGSARGDGGLAFGDFDGDSKLDLVAGDSSPSTPNRVWLGDGQGGFTAGPALEADRTRNVAVADLDGDGNLDIATANGCNMLPCNNGEPSPPNRVWLGDGNGNFHEPETRLAGTRGGALAFAAADLDGDGDTDLVDGKGQVWLGDGRGGFAAGTLIANFTEALDLALLDLDADGAPDLITATRSETRIWWGDGQGGFSLADSLTVTVGVNNWHSLALGDFDGDGDTDWAVDTYNNGTGRVIHVWANGGNRNPPQSLSAIAIDPADGNSIRSADLNGDGVADLLNYTWNDTLGFASYINDGNGGFTLGTSLLPPAICSDIATADLDGDGNDDMVIAIDGANQVWLGDGQGDFTDTGQALGNSTTSTLALADIDGDGDIDLVVANADGAASEVWLNDGSAGFSDGGRIRHADATTGTKFHDALLADLDGNGAPELIVAGYNSQQTGFTNGIRIYRNAITP